MALTFKTDDRYYRFADGLREGYIFVRRESDGKVAHFKESRFRDLGTGLLLPRSAAMAIRVTVGRWVTPDKIGYKSDGTKVEYKVES